MPLTVKDLLTALEETFARLEARPNAAEAPPKGAEMYPTWPDPRQMDLPDPTPASVVLTERIAALEAQINRKSPAEKLADSIKGFRTIFVGTAVALAPTIVEFTSQVDVNSVLGVSPKAAGVLGALMVLMRIVTKGPVPGVKP
jgi:hypothetical protein